MTASWICVLLLAVVQGIAEFLPVSSSGHLALLSYYFGINAEDSVTLGIMLHAGSLVAIVAFYFKLLIGFFKKEQLHLLLMVILASVPAAVAGVLMVHFKVEEMLNSCIPGLGIAFLITAVVLRLPEKRKLVNLNENETPSELKNISWRQALAVGLVQVGALIPGISRSGSTISAGILAGINRESAAAFSFLLALPAIAGATVLELADMLCKNSGGMSELTNVQVFTAAGLSAVVSFFALAILVKLVKRGKLSVFSWYLVLLGVFVLVRYYAGL